MAADPLPARTRTILAEITDMLVSVVGDELLVVGEITCATTFNDDLALESIEFVALAELLQQRYGASVDFLGLLAEKDIDQILAMTVGELAVHIDRVTTADPACAG
ncbi:acyl carrier protein [Streptomyces sp. NPDC048637]|uniref:acyl carrier protein n=1 Tax=Streptomyces sp. NPDC048637 TaxID=3155636 RepID=UPI00344AC748